MTWKPQLRQRIDGLTDRQAILLLADEQDITSGELDEHVEEDMAAHKSAADTFSEWKLSALKNQNRTQLMVILALLAALVGIITPIVTSR
jgi:hypothetical protein